MLVIWGKQDPRGSYEKAVEQFGPLPNVRLVGVEEAGHLPHLEKPDQFNSEVIKFLAE